MKWLKLFLMVISLSCMITVGIILTDFYLDGTCIMVEDNLIIRGIETALVAFGIIGTFTILIKEII